MSLLQTIRNDQLNARKAKETLKASLLTTLLGEAIAIGKNDGNRETTDAETIAVIKKFIKNINDTLVHREEESLIAERDILKEYLPKQLSSDELINIVSAFVEQNDLEGSKGVGAVMKYLKQNYEGQYDGAMASQVTRDVLS